MDNRTSLCKLYFDLGLNYAHILSMLAQVHSTVISMSTLKRLLRKNNLYRRKNHSDIVQVAIFIEDTISKTAGMQGYRWMHLQCRHNGLNISRDTVQTLMQIIDPVGVELRLSRRLTRREYNAKGPNYLWHIDSYDKLKRYGLCINGCIDGFSRCIMWLNAYYTSSDPKVVAGYYIETVREKSGCPFFLRGDRGTENCYVMQMQEFLTDRQSFMYGRSTANQRIEMFWCFLRKQCIQVWMDSLAMLNDEGLFDGYFLDKSLMQFCFLSLLQEDLDKMLILWNTHHIRKTRNANCPYGRPLVMYSIPALYNTHNFLHETCEQRVAACAEECVFRDDSICDEDIAELCRICMEENDWQHPTNLADGIDLYTHLRNVIYNELNID